MTISNRKVDDLKSRVNRMIDRELQRCEQAMGPTHWKEHEAWVRENIVCGARAWLADQAKKGVL